MTPELQHQQSQERPGSRRSSSRRRTSGPRFHMTPVKQKPIPRNSTAPNFVDPAGSARMTRNSSTPGFGKIARLHSQVSTEGGESHDFKIFGIHGSQVNLEGGAIN